MNETKNFSQVEPANVGLTYNDIELHRIPSDVRDFFVKQKYWKKNCTILFTPQKETPDESLITFKELSTAASFFVEIRAELDGFYINDSLVIKWTDQHDVDDGVIFYTSNNHVFYFSTKDGSVGVHGNTRTGYFLINLDISIEAQKTIRKNIYTKIFKALFEKTIWETTKKAAVLEKAEVVPGIKKQRVVGKTQAYADEEGIYFGDKKELIVAWDNIYLKDYNEGIFLFLPDDGAYHTFFEDEKIHEEHTVFVATYYVCKANRYIYFGTNYRTDSDDLEFEEYRPQIREKDYALEVLNGEGYKSIKTNDLTFQISEGQKGRILLYYIAVLNGQN